MDQGSRAGRPDKKVVPGPRYNLDDVRRLASGASIGKTRATARVQHFLDCSSPDAEKYVREELTKLEPTQYVETWEMSNEWQPPNLVLDIYHYANEDTCWYVKFGIFENRIVVVSFHKEGEHR